jgi:hypothetical protein
MCEYYEQFPTYADTHGSRQAIEALAELIWYDLVGSGAMTLPSGVQATSFTFSVFERQYGPFVGVGFESLVIRKKENGKEEVVIINPVHILNSDKKRKMNSRYLESLAFSLQAAAQKVL